MKWQVLRTHCCGQPRDTAELAVEWIQELRRADGPGVSYVIVPVADTAPVRLKDELAELAQQMRASGLTAADTVIEGGEGLPA